MAKEKVAAATPTRKKPLPKKPLPKKPLPKKPLPKKPRHGLSLSGGGYRASLFHIGALWRLNELGWLPKLTEISSVSGGSITSAYLGLRWNDLRFDGRGVAENFRDVIVAPLREMCATTIDVGAILGGLGNPVGSVAGRLDTQGLLDATVDGIGRFLPQGLVDGALKPVSRLLGAGADAAARAFDAVYPLPSPAENLIKAYDRLLFDGATLQDLPDPKSNPRFTIYATTMQSGVSLRMARDYMADYRLGWVDKPEIKLATAVAASSAFPPFFAPVEVHVGDQWRQFEGEDRQADLFGRKELTRDLDLGDGAIYDNLGLERIWRCDTVLVSDAGDPLEVQDRVAFDWLRQTLRATLITVNQVNQLRKRMLIDDLIREGEKKDGKRGTYWSTSSEIAGYGLEKQIHGEPLIPDSPKTAAQAKVRIRLNAFSDDEQESLIDWGYALADTGMRRWVLKEQPDPGKLPYPGRLP